MNAFAWRRRFREIIIKVFGRHDLAKAGGSSRESWRKRNRPAWPGAQSEVFVYKNVCKFSARRKLAEALRKLRGSNDQRWASPRSGDAVLKTINFFTAGTTLY